MKTYRVSALASALVRMWRGWRVIVPVVVVNAALQALLIWSDPTPGDGIGPLLLALVSAVVFLVSYGLVAATALKVADGPVGWHQAVATLRANAARYSAWAIGLAAVTIAGLAVYTIPGLVVLALTPFLLLAALDGQRNPLGANARTIGRRFWRWLLTTVITGAVVLVGNLVGGLTTFFVRGSVASLLVWVVSGLVLAWFTTAWALIYRSAWAEQVEAVDDAPPTSRPLLGQLDPGIARGRARAVSSRSSQRRGVEQRGSSRRAHNPEVRGSTASPPLRNRPYWYARSAVQRGHGPRWPARRGTVGRASRRSVAPLSHLAVPRARAREAARRRATAPACRLGPVKLFVEHGVRPPSTHRARTSSGAAVVDAVAYGVRASHGRPAGGQEQRERRLDGRLLRLVEPKSRTADRVE